MKIVFILALALLLSSCTDGKNAERVLTAQGFTDIEITGYRWFGCGDEDEFHTGFRAKSIVSKQSINGVYCSGWFKAGTIRFD